MLRRLSGQRTRGKCGVGVSILALGMSETHKARLRFVLCEEPGGAGKFFGVRGVGVVDLRRIC